MGFFGSLLGGIADIGGAVTGLGSIYDSISSMFGGDTSSTSQAKELAKQQFQYQVS